MPKPHVEEWLDAFVRGHNGDGDPYMARRYMPVRPAFVVLLDAMGFKGIWQRHGEERVLQKLTKVRRNVLNKRKSLKDAVPLKQQWMLPTADVRFFSDTIMVSVPLSLPLPKVWTERNLFTTSGFSPAAGDTFSEGETMGSLMVCALTAVRMAAAAWVYAVYEQPAYTLRGAIHFGLLGRNAAFAVGEALDRAATLHEQPDSAAVVLTDEAAAYFSVENNIVGPRYTFGDLTPKVVPELAHFPVQMKQAGSDVPGSMQWSINPYGAVENKYDDRLTELSQRTFGSPTPGSRVETLRGNTEAIHAQWRSAISDVRMGSPIPLKEARRR